MHTITASTLAAGLALVACAACGGTAASGPTAPLNVVVVTGVGGAGDAQLPHGPKVRRLGNIELNAQVPGQEEPVTAPVDAYGRAVISLPLGAVELSSPSCSARVKVKVTAGGRATQFLCNAAPTTTAKNKHSAKRAGQKAAGAHGR